MTADATIDAPARPILAAEVLSVGTEITVGETTDTNAGEIARSLVQAGIRVTRVQALPDELDVVVDAFRDALTRADLVVSTGGLGPTPDDLTREAVAQLLGETPTVDPELRAWLEDLWARRGQPFPEVNLKQAWVIPSASALANPHGTAPGWWVDAPDGRVIVTLPGPPREMRPMWTEQAWPRLRARGPGRDMVVRTLRLTGIGESQVADRLGDALLRARNPAVATYARVEAVDVRIAAVDERSPDGPVVRTAASLADAAEASVLAAVGEHVWARDATTWAAAIDAALEARGLSLATREEGTHGALVGLLGEAGRLLHAEVVAAPRDPLADVAAGLRARTGLDVALAMRIRPRGNDTAVGIALATAAGVQRARRLAFLSGPLGRQRAAIATAWVLLDALRRPGDEPGPA